MWDKWKRWRYNCPGWGEYVQQEGKQGEGSTFRFDTSPPCDGLEIAKKSLIWKKHQFICFKDCHCSKKIHIIKGKVQVGEMVFHFLLITVITTITIIVITITIIIISMRTTARQKEVWRGDVEQ